MVNNYPTPYDDYAMGNIMQDRANLVATDGDGSRCRHRRRLWREVAASDGPAQRLPGQDWETRAGTVELRIPELAYGHYSMIDLLNIPCR